MPPLDSATINAVLAKQGMPNTTENLNRIAQFAAVAPDMLEKYLGRGTDQSFADTSGTDAAIDRSIASTGKDAGTIDPRLTALAGPNPYKVTLDPNTGLSNIGPGLVNTPEPQGRVTVGQPTLANPNAGKRGVGGTVVDPGLLNPDLYGGAGNKGTGQITESEMNRPGVDPRVAPTQAGEGAPSNFSISDLVIPSILALFGANIARRHMGGGPKPPVPGAVTPSINPNAPTAVPRPGPTAAPTTVPPGPGVPPNAPYLPSAPPQGPAYVPGGVPQRSPVPTAPVPYENTPSGPHMPTPTTDRPPYMPPANRAGQGPEDISRMQQEIQADRARQAAEFQQQLRDQEAAKMKNTTTVPSSGGKTQAQRDAEATARAGNRATGRQ